MMLNLAAGSFSGIIFPEVPAPALLPLDRGAGDRLGDGEQVVQVERRVPARVVLPIAVHADLRGAVA